MFIYKQSFSLDKALFKFMDLIESEVKIMLLLHGVLNPTSFPKKLTLKNVHTKNSKTHYVFTLIKCIFLFEDHTKPQRLLRAA